jgi:hypothetical protein
VIYCYGDLVPRSGELFAEGGEQGGGTSSKTLLAAQLGVWVFGIFVIIIILLLIRKSIVSLKRHLEKLTDKLPGAVFRVHGYHKTLFGSLKLWCFCFIRHFAFMQYFLPPKASSSGYSAMHDTGLYH